MQVSQDHQRDPFSEARLQDVGERGLGMLEHQAAGNKNDETECERNRHLKRARLAQVQQRISVSRNYQRHRIQVDEETQVCGY